MATKSAQPEPEKLDVEESLEILDKTLDRVKALYEQYFLGIQKQPPTFVHLDLERKLRDLSGVQIRNTGLRYRYATLQQKYGSYNTYWRRTLRQIENGTYARSLSKLGRKAALTGEEIPEEILAKMPKRMRDQVRRDREAALALARRREQNTPGVEPADDSDFYEEFAKPAARVDARGAHVLSESDGDIDLEAFFASVNDESDESTHTSAPPRPPAPEFEEMPTPVPAAPSAPANLRAASLGFTPPRAASPALRAPTQPASPTPPAFPPVGKPAGRTGPHVVQREPSARVTTQPGFEPGLPLKPVGRNLSATDADELVIGARPLGRESIPPLIHSAVPVADPPSRSFAPSQISRPNPIAPGASIVKQVGVETMQGPFAREPSVVAPPRRSRRDTDVDAEMEKTPPPIMKPIPPPPARPSTQLPRQVTPTVPTVPTPTQPGRAVTPMSATPTPTAPARPTVAHPSTQQMPPRQVTQPTAAARPSIPQVPREVTTPLAAQRPGQTPPPSRTAQPIPVQPSPTPTPGSRPPTGRPPPGMSDADVSALYAKYVKAKEMVGETTGPQTYGKLLNTINAQAPKIMAEYNAKGVDFSVVVKDNQVIIRAKPKP